MRILENRYNWYKGNLHMHTTVSDGVLEPADAMRMPVYHILGIGMNRETVDFYHGAPYEGAPLGSKRVRNSSIELLRIAAMFCIVSCHFATHGKFEFDTNTVTVPILWWYFLEMGGNFGVNVFVLVSGYFLITARGELFNLRRILKFWGQVFFYSVSIYLMFRLLGIGELTSKPVTDILFPITFRQWWFASTYFVLYLLHPFINRLLRNLSKEEFQRFLVLLMIIWCMIPTISRVSFQSNNLLWFVTLYCVAAYIRL